MVVNKVTAFTKLHLLPLTLVPLDARIKVKGFCSQLAVCLVLPTGHCVESPVNGGTRNMKCTLSVVGRKADSRTHTLKHNCEVPGLRFAELPVIY